MQMTPQLHSVLEIREDLRAQQVEII